MHELSTVGLMSSYTTNKLPIIAQNKYGVKNNHSKQSQLFRTGSVVFMSSLEPFFVRQMKFGTLHKNEIITCQNFIFLKTHI